MMSSKVKYPAMLFIQKLEVVLSKTFLLSCRENKQFALKVFDDKCETAFGEANVLKYIMSIRQPDDDIHVVNFVEDFY